MGPTRFLLVNPNTSEHITTRLVRSARRALESGDALQAVTAAHGPAVIGSRTEAALAAAGVLELVARHGPGFDAVVLGVSLDCGLDAARELMAPQPVVGMTQAGLLTACLCGGRFGVLTLGASMRPLYEELIARHGLADRLAGVQAPDLPTAFDARTEAVDDGVADALASAGDALIRKGAESIVLAGAVLCGYDSKLAERLPVPVLDAVVCAMHQARGLARLGLPAPRVGSHAPPQDRHSTGLAAALAERLATGPPRNTSNR